ncbi:MAG: phage tail tape measure protein [Curvibacter sp. GWA2_64_110]|nr:MAG: phage tail tape measure protein [Curvibacter sp. GWA2_64_110]HCY15621.1 phage tail tape measure protein [Curvibacter sp.]
MSEMRLKYFIELVSNLGPKAQADAKVVEDAQRRMDAAVGRTSDRMVNLDRVIGRIGQNTSTERQIGYLQRLGQAADAAQAKMQRMRESMARGLDKAPEKFAEISAGYYGARTVMAPPIRAFANLEEATQDLRIAMTDASGKVSKDFDKISAEATKLGNQLPGTTKDFMMAARALIEQGTPTGVVAGGGLRAASYFGVLTGMDQYQSAETIAKVREAYGLKDDELVKMADLMQRGRYAFGINPSDYRMVASYAAPTYNTLGLTGLDNAKKLLAVQGIAAQVGLESSSFGTNFSMMLQRIGQFDSRVNKNSKEAREVRGLLSEHGIDMQFYNEKGQFSGVENMLAQLAKLQPLSQAEQQKVLTRLFGVEAGRPAQILVQKGQQAYQEALDKIDAQASLDQRISMKMETFSAKLEALGGTIENVMAKIATQTGQAAKPLMDGANSLLDPAGRFIENHPGVGTAGLMAGGAAGAYLMGRFGGALWKALILRGAAAPAAAQAAGALAWPVLEGAGGAASGAGAGGAAAVRAAASGIASSAQLAKMLKYGGITTGIAALLEGTAVLADPNADKARELTRVGVTNGAGLLGGALAGAAAGSVLPGLGTLLGAIGGGLAGAYGSGAIFDWLWAKPQARALGPGGALDDPRRLSLAGMGGLAMGPELKIGEGVLRLDVHVTTDGVTTQPTVLRQPSLIRISPGPTNPGSVR